MLRRLGLLGKCPGRVRPGRPAVPTVLRLLPGRLARDTNPGLRRGGLAVPITDCDVYARTLPVPRIITVPVHRDWPAPGDRGQPESGGPGLSGVPVAPGRVVRSYDSDGETRHSFDSQWFRV